MLSRSRGDLEDIKRSREIEAWRRGLNELLEHISNMHFVLLRSVAFEHETRHCGEDGGEQDGEKEENLLKKALEETRKNQPLPFRGG